MHSLRESDYLRIHGELDLMDPNNEVIVAHVHTQWSDGLRSPRQHLYSALELGIKTVIFQDHDTMKGYYEAQDIKEKESISDDELQIRPGQEITTKENFHIGSIDNSEPIPYWFPYRETVRKINESGGQPVALHLGMDDNSLTWEMVDEQNKSDDQMDHIRLVEGVNGGDLKKTEHARKRLIWKLIFQQPGSSERALHEYSINGRQKEVNIIGGPDAHYYGDFADVVQVYPKNLDPVQAMLAGETSIYAKNKQSHVSIMEFFLQRKQAKMLQKRRVSGLI